MNSGVIKKRSLDNEPIAEEEEEEEDDEDDKWVIVNIDMCMSFS